MATGDTRVLDVIVPEIFGPYTQQQTEEKSRIIQSGVMVPDQRLNQVLAGGGTTFNEPSLRDLDDDDDNVSTDNPAVASTPNKIGTSVETQIRLSRNNSWSTMDLASILAGVDVADRISDLVAGYWTRRLQKTFIATIKGVYADNAAAPTGTEHVQGDMTHDISAGGTFTDGVTNFNASGLIDAAATMGDSYDDLGLLIVHSVVYATMRKNNLIEFIPDSQNPAGARIATYQGQYRVIVDDGLTPTGGVFESWLFGNGSVRFGSASLDDAVETDRIPAAGNGGGQGVLHNRVQWIIHPVGLGYVGTAANGGPSNASTVNNLAHADSWQRVFPERKQIKMARLVTTEF